MSYISEFNYNSVIKLKNDLKKLDIILFGASKMGEKVFNELKNGEVKVNYFCDNDCKRHGQSLLETNIISLEKLNEFPKDVNIIISSSYTEEISKQLKNMNFNNVYITYFTEILSENGEESELIYFNYVKEIDDILMKNSIYENSCENKRAFLLATGPSIKMENMKLLENEDCYSVSNFFLHGDINTINPKFHFFAPYHKPLILENYIDWLRVSDRKLPLDTEIFLEISTKRFIDDFNIFNNRKIHYLKFTSNPDKDKVDLSNYVMGPQTGPIMILPVLIYMGYSEIYLLGCDHTVLRDYGKITSNFYDKGEDPRINATSDKAWFGIIKYLDATKNMFLQYQFYKDMLFEKNTKIINLSKDSWLDIFQYDRLENIIKR